jgi:hypothetical protein
MRFSGSSKPIWAKELSDVGAKTVEGEQALSGLTPQQIERHAVDPRLAKEIERVQALQESMGAQERNQCTS